MGKSLAVICRPECFAEVIGQDAIVSILQRQIALKTFKNAYLFTGPSGDGKTTMARIFASTINDGEGSPIELDAASNNGIDFIRAIIQDAQQAPIDCNYKVYIIDECHQLTRAAWDAALKLIEEPPLRAIFIFCTTNWLKIPETILSRVQRFDFKRVTKLTIADRLEFICNERLNINYERIALERIAALADGNVRNAITILEQCYDYSEDLTLANVEKVLGLVSYDLLFDFVNALLTNDSNKAINALINIKLLNSDLVLTYDTIISFITDYAITLKSENIRITNIPYDFRYKLLDKEVYSKLFTLMNRFIDLRKFINNTNVEIFIKLIILEVCKEDAEL